ncbi:MAG: ATP-binding cassette domain-containing protein [Coriobacteriia bacterium]|nr:ATP-binding cassette domain-containing protein [Coriobacteriia bacterium]MCL2745742.1 ATP-binding cassette domain-containing protein [Coriobacteriia bacterium]MCL2870881.1 ATP-binding cassette domain-containing protein [Coriobacteriia bacterium]
MSKRPIIEVKNFTKKYGNFTAVDDISFDVEEGSIFAFLGPNGAGKSTTINTLCTIFEGYEGELRIDGKDVARQKNDVRSSIGVVFQDTTLDKKMTIEENLRMHCVFYGVPSSEVEERIVFVLTLVDLLDWRKRSVSALSGGMMRRVEIARGLMHYPKVLFLDEPTSGLDPQTRAHVWEYMLRLQKEKNITIFLTTHYMDEAEICDQVAVMDKGKIIAHDTPFGLKKQYTKDRAYVTTSNPILLETLLDEQGMNYEKREKFHRILVDDSAKLLHVLAECKDEVTDIEVRKGTLNDVFLEITGREIREGGGS